MDWIKILLTNQQSRVINGGSTTSFFKLEKGAGQGDPISAYLFIIALEIIFAMIKSNPNIKDLNIFNHNYLYTAYADDTTFFLSDQKSIRELLETFKLFWFKIFWFKTYYIEMWECRHRLSERGQNGSLWY